MDRIFISAAASFITLVLIAGCKATPTPQPNPRPMSQEDVARVLGPGKEEVALLALKEDMDEAVVRLILTEYLKEHDLAYVLLSNTDAFKNNPALALDPEANARIGDTLRELAARNSLPPSRVADLVFQYRLWRATMNRRDN